MQYRSQSRGKDNLEFLCRTEKSDAFKCKMLSASQFSDTATQLNKSPFCSCRYCRTFSPCSQEVIPIKSPCPSGTSSHMEAGSAESHCHCGTRPGESYLFVPRCTGSQGKRHRASARAWCLHCLCGAGQHQTGAAVPPGRKEPHFRFPAEEQSWRDASHLH